jgi:hypothetical protein
MNGMPKEVAHTILDEALSALSEKNTFGSGELLFDRAWYHPVDSNRNLFRILTRSLIRILDPALATVSDEAIIEVFNQTIRGKTGV